jgi:hydroxylamine dehydrogenase
VRTPLVPAVLLLLAFAIILPSSAQTVAPVSAPTISDETAACLSCHESFQPGIVQDWRHSRHAGITPAQALTQPKLQRRVSADSIPAGLANVAVGCYECHGRNPESHRDNFDHFGYRINVVVSPRDCQTCHPVEAGQFARGKKAHAVENLEKNPLYMLLVESVIGMKEYRAGAIMHGKPSSSTSSSTCFACHGTHVDVAGTKHLVTDQGELDVPTLTNWPNQGVGRINPDGSAGACTACHPRHGFSIETARKPYTCAQCHLQPDLPAWDVYAESKHGNIVLSQQQEYRWDPVPWTPGVDVRAPSCATCHISLLASGDGSVIVERSHEFANRLFTRIFGLPYAHPQPISGATWPIRNKDGQSLPTTFLDEPASAFLIDATEQQTRKNTMISVCRSCHGTDWAQGHFAHLDTAVAESNRMTATTTRLLGELWQAKKADPANPFDEAAEQTWVESWLFYANCIRYAAAMSGQDYATFKYGWWEMTKAVEELREKLPKAKTSPKK